MISSITKAIGLDRNESLMSSMVQLGESVKQSRIYRLQATGLVTVPIASHETR